MTRSETEEYITLTYNAEGEHPWAPDAMHTVFRHAGNRKWFAVIMDISKRRLGFDSDDTISIMNIKCGPIMSGSLQHERGIFPAYHMNKANWVSVALDGTADDDRIKFLIDISFDLTASKPPKHRNNESS